MRLGGAEALNDVAPHHPQQWTPVISCCYDSRRIRPGVFSKPIAPQLPACILKAPVIDLK
jgi:hypothetical protein